MLHILDLGPDEIRSIDPFGYGRHALSMRFPQKATFASPSSLFVDNSNPTQARQLVGEIHEQYRRQFETLNCLKHTPILEYDCQMDAKFGPQGGHFSLDVLKANLLESYQLADRTVTFDSVVERGIETFCRILAIRRDAVGYPQIDQIPLFRNTGAGLPRGGRKTEWRNHVDGAAPWRHVLPDLPSGRRQRSKDRVIHEDAVLNVDYLAPQLTAVRQWLCQQFPQLFAGWLNPVEHLYPKITAALLSEQWFLETDYKSMDVHFQWQAVQHCVLPIYNVLLPEGEYLHLAAFVEELFQQPIFMGSQLWTGSHDLLSGQVVTNDFETLMDVVLFLGSYLDAGGTVLGFFDAFSAVGDDVLISGSHDLMLATYERVKRVAPAVGLVLSEEKTRMQTGSCRFCRMVYYASLPRLVNQDGLVYVHPAYPPILALNSTLQPEHAAHSQEEELLSTFIRLDNCVGYYRFADFAAFVLRLVRGSVRQRLPILTDEQFQKLQMRDWWFRVYGTTYTLADSPSALIWRSLEA